MAGAKEIAFLTPASLGTCRGGWRGCNSDFAATRAALRLRHLVGLARVTASEYGKRSAGYAQACELLGVST